jgi:hypothetical protein
MLSLVVRHTRQRWRLNLILLLSLTLLAGAMAGLPAYGSAIGTRSLREMVSSYKAPPARNILISASAGTRLDGAVYDAVEDKLGDILVERIDVRTIKVPVHEGAGELEGPRPLQKYHYVRLWAFEDLGQEVRAVEGRLPLYDESIRSAGSEPPALEVAIGVDGILRTELSVGDVVTVATPQGSIALNIVGIIEPVEPTADRWWDDQTTFGIHVKLLGRSTEIITVSLFVSPQAMEDWFPGYDLSWRLLVDSSRINVGNVRRIQETMTNLQAQLRNRKAELHSRLPEILVDFQAKQVAMRMLLFLWIAHTLVFGLYVVLTIASYLLERSVGEMATLVSRGGNRLQVTLIFALESLLLALLAALLGTFAAWGILCLGGMATRDLFFRLPPESWGLTLLTVGLGWLGMGLSAYQRTSGASFGLRRWPIRPEDRPAWQRLYLDLVLAGFGSLLYWQLSRSGSFVMRRIGTTPLTDSFLLLGSSVLLIAVVLLLLRVLPRLLGLVAWIFRQSWGLIWPIGLTHSARACLEFSRVVLPVTLATSLILFASVSVSSLRVSQAEVAHYRSGADLRISAKLPTAWATAQDIADLPGVLVVSPAVRTDALGSSIGGTVELLAIDPETFAQTARYPQGTGNLPLLELAHVLLRETSTRALPAIVSRSLLTSRDNVGGLVALTIGYQELFFEICAIVDEFPTLREDFVVTDWHALGQRIDLDRRYFRLGELWLTTDPAHHDALAKNPAIVDHILADAQAELRSLRSDAMARGVAGIFYVGSVVLGLLSVAGFLPICYFSARKRIYEFDLLRIIGLTPGQVLGLLVAEGVLVVGIGTVVGTIVGYGLTEITLPYLSQAWAASLGGVEIRRIVVVWPAVLRLYGVLAGCYALAMGCSLLALARTSVLGALRLSEE